jgi:hypothetical protein
MGVFSPTKIRNVLFLMDLAAQMERYSTSPERRLADGLQLHHMILIPYLTEVEGSRNDDAG